ncbi:MAG: SoxR reducing system RseC family protein [Desulfamplus sp.]|nr:SoxR reducing system RseC family protein [Desulfamplus sp.]
MVTKDGVVVGVSGANVIVKTKRSKSCESCESKDSCLEHSKTDEMTVEVFNSLNASIGDSVVVGFNTAPLLKLTFILYIFPILLLLIGAYMGEFIAIRLDVNISNTSMVIGVLFFFSSFFIIRLINNLWGQKSEYQPFLIRFMQRASSCSVNLSPKI